MSARVICGTIQGYITWIKFLRHANAGGETDQCEVLAGTAERAFVCCQGCWGAALLAPAGCALYRQRRPYPIYECNWSTRELCHERPA